MPIYHKAHSKENCRKFLREHAMTYLKRGISGRKVGWAQAWAVSYSEAAEAGCGRIVNGKFVFYSDLRRRR